MSKKYLRIKYLFRNWNLIQEQKKKCQKVNFTISFSTFYVIIYIYTLYKKYEGTQIIINISTT